MNVNEPYLEDRLVGVQPSELLTMHPYPHKIPERIDKKNHHSKLSLIQLMEGGGLTEPRQAETPHWTFRGLY